jgi:flagellar biosynthesis protein FlhG
MKSTIRNLIWIAVSIFQSHHVFALTKVDQMSQWHLFREHKIKTASHSAAYSQSVKKVKLQGSEGLIMKDQRKLKATEAKGQSQMFQKMDNVISQKILVMSATLGIGKSFVSLHLAHSLAELGKKVLLVDLNLRRPVLHLYASDRLHYPIKYWLEKGEVISRKALIPVYQNLDLLGNCFGDGQKPKREQKNVDQFLDLYRPVTVGYDYIILDTQTGLSELNLSLLQDSDRILVVSSTDPVSIIDTYTLIKASHPYLQDSVIQLIINLAVDAAASEEAHKSLNYALQSFLNYEINLFGVIPVDDKVRISTVHRKPLWQFSTYSQAMQEIVMMSKKLYTSKSSKIPAEIV